MKRASGNVQILNSSCKHSLTSNPSVGGLTAESPRATARAASLRQALPSSHVCPALSRGKGNISNPRAWTSAAGAEPSEMRQWQDKAPSPMDWFGHRDKALP